MSPIRPFRATQTTPGKSATGRTASRRRSTELAAQAVTPAAASARESMMTVPGAGISREDKLDAAPIGLIKNGAVATMTDRPRALYWLKTAPWMASRFYRRMQAGNIPNLPYRQRCLMFLENVL